MKVGNHISPLLLEQYILGELDSDLKEEIDEKIKRDPDLFEKVNQMKNENRVFLSKHPVSLIQERIDNIAKSKKKSSGVSVGFYYPQVIALTVVMVVGFTVYNYTLNKKKDSDTFSSIKKQNIKEVTRIKGHEKLELFIQDKQKARKLKNREIVTSGDVIEVKIQTDAPYGMILSIDGRNVVTLHYPYNETDSTRLISNLRPRAYQLDDAPRFERFIFITSKKPINIKKILNIVKKTKRVASEKPIFESISDNIREHSLILYKK
jgi:hypothetical protein